MPKVSISELRRREPTSEEENAIREACWKGPPIVGAILGLIMVEIELNNLLKWKLKESGKVNWEKLSGQAGPAHTFSQKALLGCALGLYDHVVYDHLDRVRNVRNTFAHAKVMVDFDSPEVQAEIRGAALPAKQYSELYKFIKSVRSKRTGNRDAFNWLVSAVYIELLKKKSRSLKAQIEHHKRKRKLETANALSFGFNPTGQFGDALYTQIANELAKPHPETNQLSSLLFGTEPSILDTLPKIVRETGSKPK